VLWTASFRHALLHPEHSCLMSRFRLCRSVRSIDYTFWLISDCYWHEQCLSVAAGDLWHSFDIEKKVNGGWSRPYLHLCDVSVFSERYAVRCAIEIALSPVRQSVRPSVLLSVCRFTTRSSCEWTVDLFQNLFTPPDLSQLWKNSVRKKIFAEVFPLRLLFIEKIWRHRDFRSISRFMWETIQPSCNAQLQCNTNRNS